MACPCSIGVLQIENLLSRLRMPLLPFLAAGALQTNADIEIGKELFAADRAKALDESRVGKLGANPGDVLRILFSILLCAAQLFERLRALIERPTGGFPRR